jgi:hypothetical protein
MTPDNSCFYLQNRLIQTSQTGGQWYSNTYPFSIPWQNIRDEPNNYLHFMEASKSETWNLYYSNLQETFTKFTLVAR